jgi:hypothetical protein
MRGEAASSCRCSKKFHLEMSAGEKGWTDWNVGLRFKPWATRGERDQKEFLQEPQKPLAFPGKTRKTSR